MSHVLTLSDLHGRITDIIDGHRSSSFPRGGGDTAILRWVLEELDRIGTECHCPDRTETR